MGKIRVVSAMTNSMKDVALQGPPRDVGFGSDRTLPTGEGCRDSEIDATAGIDRALDSSRSRGFGRYEI
jgi:hypothetical protein